MEKIVYLDIKFWDKFVESFPDYIAFMDTSISKMENYIGMYRFISSAHLKLNISAQDILKKVESDDRLKMLWKKSTEGCCKLDFDAEMSDGKQLSTTEDLNAIYLLGDDRRRDYEKFGVMTITPNSIEEIGYLFKDSGRIIKKGDRGNWDFLSNFDHSFNSILIADPYILKTTDTFDSDIYAILTALLPIESASTFHISIISNEFNHEPKCRYEKIKKFIKKERPNLNFTFTLYEDEGKDKVFHDRSIITNNVMINIGAGFGIYNKSKIAKNNTSVSIIYPHFNSSIVYAISFYNNIVDGAKDIFEKTKDKLWIPGKTDPKAAKCWGDGVKNRLLE